MIYAAPVTVTDTSTCFFYHSMDLPQFGFQEGVWDLRGRLDDYLGGTRCAGKRVLDVGSASGFLSFATEAAGASEVVSFDMDDARRQHLLPFHHKEYYRDHCAWVASQTAHINRWHNAYWLAHRAFGSSARVAYGDVYHIPAELGSFDVVIVGALLEHLSDPIGALASIARRCAATLVINTAVIETEEPIAKFAGRANAPDFDYTFWFYSIGVYREILGMLGFTIARLVTREFRCNAAGGSFPRTAIVAERN
jgi:SAM-dependent methyltransferase